MTPKLKRTLALALAGGSLAIGVPAAAVAAGGGDGGAGTTSPPAATIQDEQQPRPDREDCPEKDGSGSGTGNGAADDTTAL